MLTFLPEDARAEVKAEYGRRLLAVAFGLTAVTMLAGAALAVPSYVVVTEKHREALVATKAQASVDPETIARLEKTVKDIGVKVAALKGSGAQRTILSVLELVGERLTPGIALNSIVIKRGEAGSVILSGTASTRDALVTFSKSLQAEPSFSGISLPISSLAKSRDISFSISINSRI